MIDIWFGNRATMLCVVCRRPFGRGTVVNCVKGDLVKLKMGRIGLMLGRGGAADHCGGAAAVYAQSTYHWVIPWTSSPSHPDRMVVPAGRDTFILQNTGQFPITHIEGNGV